MDYSSLDDVPHCVRLFATATQSAASDYVTSLQHRYRQQPSTNTQARGKNGAVLPSTVEARKCFRFLDLEMGSPDSVATLSCKVFGVTSHALTLFETDGRGFSVFCNLQSCQAEWIRFCCTVEAGLRFPIATILTR